MFFYSSLRLNFKNWRFPMYRMASTIAAGCLLASGVVQADVFFCGQGTLTINASTSNEVGVVISEAKSNTDSGKVVAKMNNYHGKGAGPYWDTGMGPVKLEGGPGCYLVAISSKNATPGSGSWTCDIASVTSVAQNGFTFSATDPNTYKIVAFGQFAGLQFDPTKLETETKGPNCPPPGQ